MITKNVKVPEGLVNLIESLQYEANARKDLLAFMLNNGMGETEGYTKYHYDYIEFSAKFDIAKRDFEQNFVKVKYPDAISWNLDFASNTVAIVLRDDVEESDETD